MKLTEAEPGDRLQQKGRRVEIVDHGTERRDGRLRRWVDYSDLDEHDHRTGEVMRAAAGDDEPTGWRRVLTGAKPDFELDLRNERIVVTPTTARGRDYCRHRFGHRGETTIAAERAPEIIEQMVRAGLRPYSGDLLALFLAGKAIQQVQRNGREQ